MPSHPVTPDGRYFVVKGRLWRCRDPRLRATERETLVHALMAARRAVRAALATGDADELAAARKGVDAAKRGLGERGPVWWADGAPDLNRRLAATTPYAEWSTSSAPPAEMIDMRTQGRPVLSIDRPGVDAAVALVRRNYDRLRPTAPR